MMEITDKVLDNIGRMENVSYFKIYPRLVQCFPGPFKFNLLARLYWRKKKGHRGRRFNKPAIKSLIAGDL